MSLSPVFTPIRSAKKTMSHRESAKITQSFKSSKLHFDSLEEGNTKHESPSHCATSDICSTAVSPSSSPKVPSNEMKRYRKRKAKKNDYNDNANCEQFESSLFLDDPFAYDDVRRLSDRFEAHQITRPRDPNKWTPCKSKGAALRKPPNRAKQQQQAARTDLLAAFTESDS